MYQQSIQFFWPLTEQIPLDLDYADCDKPKLYSNASVLSVGDGVTWTTVATNIAPQLTVTPIDSVGQLSIGGINVGLETEPRWYQKVLFKLLGFNWKDK